MPSFPKGVKVPRFLDKENPYEKEIEKKVCKYGLTLGLQHRKYANPSRRAAPDQIFFRKGRAWAIETFSLPYVFFIEFKSRGEVPTAAQLEEHAVLRSYGFLVFVVDNIEDGKAILRLMC